MKNIIFAIVCLTSLALSSPAVIGECFIKIKNNLGHNGIRIDRTVELYGFNLTKADCYSAAGYWATEYKADELVVKFRTNK